MFIPYAFPLILALLAPFLIQLVYGRRLPQTACWLISIALCYLLLFAAMRLRVLQLILDAQDYNHDSAYRFAPLTALFVAVTYHLLLAALFIFIQKWRRR